MEAIKYFSLLIVFSMSFCSSSNAAMDEAEAKVFIESINSSWQNRDYDDLKKEIEQQLQEHPESAFVLSVTQYYYLYIEGDISQAHYYANLIRTVSKNFKEVGRRALAREFTKMTLDVPLSEGGKPSGTSSM